MSSPAKSEGAREPHKGEYILALEMICHFQPQLTTKTNRSPSNAKALEESSHVHGRKGKLDTTRDVSSSRKQSESY